MTDRPSTYDAMDEHFAERHRQWKASNWRRYLFPALWLVYCAQTGSGVYKHSHGWAAVAGYALLVAFCACYVCTLSVAWTRNLRRFWPMFGLGILLTAAEVCFARDDAFVFCVYLAVLSIAGLKERAAPIVLAMALIATYLPPLIPS